MRNSKFNRVGAADTVNHEGGRWIPARAAMTYDGDIVELALAIYPATDEHRVRRIEKEALKIASCG